MAHINSIGAGIYSRVLFETSAWEATFSVSADQKAHFATALVPPEKAADSDITPADNSFTEVADMREAPSFGTPPSLVNVPNFGSKTSRQVQGQADPTNLEISINYIPQKWTNGGLGQFIGDGKDHLFAAILANAIPGGGGLADYAISSGGVGRVQNSITYFVGELAAIQFTPNLTDSNQGTVTIALKSDFSQLMTV